jgi:hypothetical protein
MVHPYLASEGVWRAKGVYTDVKNRSLDATGRCRMIHGHGVWQLHSTMSVEQPQGVREFSLRYEIVPLGGGKTHTHWTSHNSSLGHLVGEMTLVGDAILSSFTSESKRYRGFEFLLLVQELGYVNRGVLFEGDKRLSSWQMSIRPWCE